MVVGVVGASLVALDHRHDPVRKIAYVDKRYKAIRTIWSQDFTATATRTTQ